MPLIIVAHQIYTNTGGEVNQYDLTLHSDEIYEISISSRTLHSMLGAEVKSLKVDKQINRTIGSGNDVDMPLYSDPERKSDESPES